MAPPKVPMLDRLATKFTVGDGCWEWTGARSGNGYGAFWLGDRDGNMGLAHRVVYEVLNGPIPAQIQLDHRCHNRGCVRPSHLEPVTPAENTRRSRLCPSCRKEMDEWSSH